MIFPSHLTSALIAGKFIGLLNPVEWLVVILASVGLDIDHVWVNLKYVCQPKIFFRNIADASGRVRQHTWIQEFVFGLLAGVIFGFILAWLFKVRWWIFPLFQLIHILLDGIMRVEHQPLAPFSKWNYRGFVPPGTKIEWIVSTVILVLAVWFFFV